MMTESYINLSKWWGFVSKKFLEFFISPVSHRVESKNFTFSVLFVVGFDDLEFLGKDIESELILFFGSIRFTILSNIVVELGLHSWVN
jgi:hypothetical protein